MREYNSIRRRSSIFTAPALVFILFQVCSRSNETAGQAAWLWHCGICWTCLRYCGIYRYFCGLAVFGPPLYRLISFNFSTDLRHFDKVGKTVLFGVKSRLMKFLNCLRRDLVISVQSTVETFSAWMILIRQLKSCFELFLTDWNRRDFLEKTEQQFLRQSIYIEHVLTEVMICSADLKPFSRPWF